MGIENILSTLGLCIKAGRCEIGESGCVAAIRAEKAILVLLDATVGFNTGKRIRNACAFRNIPLYEYDPRIHDVAFACGVKAKVIAVTDEGFARLIIKKLAEIDLK